MNFSASLSVSSQIAAGFATVYQFLKNIATGTARIVYNGFGSSHQTVTNSLATDKPKFNARIIP